MSTVLFLSQVPLPGYLLSEVTNGLMIERFRACSLITGAVWAHGFDSTPAVERELWRQLYIRELQRRSGGKPEDPVLGEVVTRPRRLEILSRIVPDRTPRRSA